MDGLLSLLLFAVLFAVMMRFGCGAHMAHGRHGGHRSKHVADDKHTDPVCHKDVPPSEGYGKMYAGTLYRFCSKQCLDAFEAAPEQFLGKQHALTSTS